MAKVTLTLTDGPGGLLVSLQSDELLPDEHEAGTPAQEMGLIALHTVRREFKDITGKELVPIKVH